MKTKQAPEPTIPVNGFDPDRVIETVCDLLHIDTTQLIAAQRVAGSAKLALAAIASVLKGNNAMTYTQIATLLRVPVYKAIGAVNEMDSGNLDTVACHHDFKTALHFYSACLGALRHQQKGAA